MAFPTETYAADLGDMRGTRRYWPTTYLSNPILYTPFESFKRGRRAHLAKEKMGKYESLFHRMVDRFVVVHMMPGTEFHLVTPDQYPDLLNALVDSHPTAGELRTALRTSMPIITAAAHGIASEAEIRDWGTMVPDQDEIMALDQEYAKLRFYERFIFDYHTLRAAGRCQAQSLTYPGIEAITDGEVWLISSLPGVAGPVVLTHEQLLMLKDSLYSRFNVFVASRWLYPGRHLEPKIHALFEWQEDCLREYGNAGYEVAKMTEALSSAYLSRVAGCVLSGPGDSYALMLEKGRTKERKIRDEIAGYDNERPFLIDALATLLEKVDDFQMVVELFGLQKCTGHPLIDPVKGGRSAAHEARTTDHMSASDAVELRNSWLMLYILGHLAKHRRYPKFAVNPERGTRFYTLWRDGNTRIHRTSFPISDLTNVRLAKAFEFDVFPNYLDLLDDKSISFERDERRLFWDKSGGESGTARTNRRLLLEMLARPEIRPEEIHEQIEKGEIPLSWLIVSITPKEREFKLNPRMFAMFVFEVRQFFTMHEANLAANILPYMTQLTMTDSRRKVQERFLNLTRSRLDSSGRPSVLFGFDLSRWNLRWRGEYIDPIGVDLNCLFGTLRTFTTGHKFFTDSLISVRVRNLRPEYAEELFPPEGDLEWYNHKGGFEGILQKLWSIATVAMMENALRDLPIAYTWTIQGDNVTAVVTLPPTPEGDTDEGWLKRWVPLVLDRAEAATRAVNQDLKPEECVVSTEVAQYSKDTYKRGVEFYTSLKFLSRVFPSAATDFPSIPAQIGSIFSSTVAAAERCKDPIICYFLGLFHGALYLSRLKSIDGYLGRRISGLEHLRRESFIQYCLIVPPELGGYPILHLDDYLYKGGADPLGKALCGLVRLSLHFPLAKRVIAEAYSDKLYVDDPTPSGLIRDPYGLPIRKKLSPADAVARDSLKVLRNFAVNHEVVEVTSSAITEFDEDLCNHLARVTPFIPQIMHDIRACSVAGRADALTKRFTATQSLQAMCRGRSEVDIVQSIITAGAAIVANLHRRYIRAETGVPDHRITSIYDLTKTLRRRWEGACVSPVGVSSYMPSDFRMSYGSEKKAGIVLTGVYPSELSTTDDRGPFEPYWGTETQEKSSEHGYRIVKSSSASSDMSDLQRIMVQVGSDPGVIDTLDAVGLTRTELRLSDISPYLSVVRGGTNIHRYRDQKGERGASVGGQMNFATYVSINSDAAGEISATTDDYPIMFQEVFCFGIALLHLRKRYNARVGEFDRLTIEMDALSMEMLPDDTLRLEGDCTLVPVSLYDNKLVYTKDIYLRQISGPIGSTRFPLPSPIDDPRSLAEAALISLFHAGIGDVKEMAVAGGKVWSAGDIRIDILELKGLGVKRVLQLAALVCAERTLALTANGWSKNKVRESVRFVVSTYAPKIAAGLLPYLRHPSLSQSDDVVSLRLAPGPRYISSGGDVASIGAFISRRTYDLLEHSDSELYREGTTLFLSDPTDRATEAVHARLVKALVKAMIEQEISRDELDVALDRLDEARRNKGLVEEPLRQQFLYTSGLGLSEWARQQGYALLEHALNEAVSAPWLRLCQESAKVTLRLARSLETQTVDMAPLSLPPSALTVGNFRPLRVYHLPSDLYAEIVEVASSPSEISLVLRDVEYHTGMCPLRASSALCSWWPVRELFRGKGVLIVGSGLGACALSALLGGALGVRGHDLRKDMPVDHASVVDYIPPLVRLCIPYPAYAQSLESYSTSGDWFSPKVSSSLLSAVSPGEIVVLDIQGHDGYSPRVLEPLYLARYRGDICVRWQGAQSIADRIVGTFATALVVTGLWEVRRTSDFRDLIIYGTFTGRPCQAAVTDLSISVVQTDDPLPDQLLDSTWCENQLFTVIGGAFTGPPTQKARQCLEAIEESVGKYVGRPTHDTWTQIRRLAATCMWIQLPPAARVTWLRRAVQDQSVTIVLNNQPYIVLWDQTLSRMITHLASRLV